MKDGIFESVQEVKDYLNSRVQKPWGDGLVYLHLRDVRDVVSADLIASILCQFGQYGPLIIDWDGTEDYPDLIKIRLLTY